VRVPRPVRWPGGRRRRWERRRSGDGGSGVVLVLGLVAVVLGIAMLVSGWGAATVARHRAEAAADLAALAAATPDLPDCARAADVAARSGAALVSCTVRGDGSVFVAVTVALPGWLDRLAGGRRPVARARAGRPDDMTAGMTAGTSAGTTAIDAVPAGTRAVTPRIGMVPCAPVVARLVRRPSAGSD